MTQHLNIWLNIAAVLAFVGAAVYLTCLSSTTYWDD